MRISRIISIIFLSAPVVLSAQSLTVKLGEVIKRSEANAMLTPPTPKSVLGGLVGAGGSTYYKFLYDTKDGKAYLGCAYFGAKYYNVGILDEYVNLKGAEKLSAEFVDDPKEKIQIEGFVEIEGKKFIVYSVNYASLNESSVYVNQLDDNMVIMGSPIRLVTFSGSKKETRSIYFETSLHKKTFLISRLVDVDEKKDQGLECTAFDMHFNTLWSKTFALNEKTKKATAVDFQIDDAGNVYILALQHPKPKEDIPAIHTYLWKEKAYHEEALNRPEHKSFGAKLFILNGHEPVVAGMYRESRVDGVFCYRINTITGIPEEMLYAPIGDEINKGLADGLENLGYGVRQMEKLPSGNYVFSMDDHRIMSGKSTTYHISTSAYVLAFKAEEGIVWERLVHKKQAGSLNHSVNGHVMLRSGDHVFVVYNDHPANFDKSLTDKSVGNYTSIAGHVVVQEIDAEGNIKKYALLEEEEGKNYNLLIRHVNRVSESLYHVELTHRDFFSIGDHYRYATLSTE